MIVGAAVALGALLVLAAWLRWQYAQTISLYVDEFTTLWAARRTLELGAPLMPSGVLYTRGLLATYVTALAGALGGLDYTTGRVPSIFFGLATIAAIFAAGRREWNARVGWLAALAARATDGVTLLFCHPGATGEASAHDAIAAARRAEAAYLGSTAFAEDLARAAVTTAWPWRRSSAG